MVVANSLEHYRTEPHPDVKEEWIIGAIAEPDHTDNDGDDLYFSFISEIEKWIRVVVTNDRLLTAYIDRRPMKWWGAPR
jgi:hypothetical protein